MSRVTVTGDFGGFLNMKRTLLMASSAAVLADLRRAGVRRIDVLVVSSGGATRLVADVRHRWHVGEVRQR